MIDSRITDELKRHDRMKADRSVFESHWQEVALYTDPSNDTFQSTVRPAGRKNTQNIFDSTAIYAKSKCAAALESMLIPSTLKWHGLRPVDPSLDDDPAVRSWCEQVVDILFRVRQSPRGRFQPNMGRAFNQVVAYGNGIVYVEDEPGVAIRYRAVDLASVYWQEDFAGGVDTVHRSFQATGRQLMQQFKTLPPTLAERAQKNQDQKFQMLHCVRPSADLAATDSRYRFAKWLFTNWYISRDTQEMVLESGMAEMPYAIGRFEQAPQEIYGRGPLMKALPDIKMLNEMMKTIISAGQKVVNPPVLLNNDGVLQAFAMRPGALNFGGVSDTGALLAQPFESKAKLDIGLELVNQVRSSINEACYIDLFRVLVEKPPQITAYEAALRAQEKGELLGPSGSQMQSDMLSAIVARELGILMRSPGALPPMPPQLAQSGGVRVEYVSPLNLAQRTPEGVAILNTLNAIAGLIQIDPSVGDVFDGQKTALELADINGVPQKVLRTPDQLAAMTAQRQETAQMTNIVNAAKPLSEAAKNLAGAHATAASVPQPLPAAA